MKENLIIAGKLTLICFVAVVLLTLINFVTAKKIKQNQTIVEENANKLLIPEGNKFVKKPFTGYDPDTTGFYYYEVKKGSTLIGYIVSVIGKGYGGAMKVMVAFDLNLKILNMKLLSNAETPGIGKKAEKQEYMAKFINTNTKEKPFPYNKSMLSQSDKDSITGATITFNGVTGAGRMAIDLLKKQIGE
ncbi:MAG: hypothetical protein A2086_03475 [Spirochaetes bacterium GWD1_27_9]|nr:MAG: hypothetical protein A2Y34_16235 [Spirochaetes bacterium GWC1_27_15]OHD39135.1 MAG: hypothetical protein A2086_03475 [Spirochaetes bacterium GWD1_27_9]